MNLSKQGRPNVCELLQEAGHVQGPVLPPVVPALLYLPSTVAAAGGDCRLCWAGRREGWKAREAGGRAGQAREAGGTCAREQYCKHLDLNVHLLGRYKHPPYLIIFMVKIVTIVMILMIIMVAMIMMR